MTDDSPGVGMERFDHAIVEDTGEFPIQRESRRFGASDMLRLTESEVEALLEWDRVVTKTRNGTKIVVEIFPDHDRNKPVEIRETAQEGRSK